MLPIEDKLFSPFQKKGIKGTVRANPNTERGFSFDYENTITWERLDATVNRIRASEGYPIKSFRNLVDEVANVTLSNKKYEMYYRGQTVDYKNNQAKFHSDRIPKTTIYPTICRPDKNPEGLYKKSIRKVHINDRYEDLSKMIELVRGKTSYYNEYYYSLFQHYEILPTPLIDITQSLRIAATFALMNSTKGYVYVFGLPYANQSISYYSDLEIVLIKLQNVVPVDAIRPRYQEGYLVGKYPIRPTKTSGDDLANRMIAKFLVDNTNGKFWDTYFKPMPQEILFPVKDKVQLELMELKKRFTDSTAR